MLLISSIDQHYNFLIIDDILGIMFIKKSKFCNYMEKGIKTYYVKNQDDHIKGHEKCYLM